IMPLACGYRPVRKLARLGEQSGVVANAFVKRAPSRASRSMFGVSTNGWPATRISSQRMSSTSTMTMFGRRGFAEGRAVFCVSPGAAHVVVKSAATRTNRGVFNRASAVAKQVVGSFILPQSAPDRRFENRLAAANDRPRVNECGVCRLYKNL